MRTLWSGKPHVFASTALIFPHKIHRIPALYIIAIFSKITFMEFWDNHVFYPGNLDYGHPLFLKPQCVSPELTSSHLVVLILRFWCGHFERHHYLLGEKWSMAAGSECSASSMFPWYFHLVRHHRCLPERRGWLVLGALKVTVPIGKWSSNHHFWGGMFNFGGIVRLEVLNNMQI